MVRSIHLKALLLALPVALVTTFSTPPALANLPVGSLREIEGDVTCARGTGGILVYAETANYLIYICSDANDPTAPRFYRSRNRDGSPGLNLEAVGYNPRQLRYFEFLNNGYTYVLQIPSAQIPNPVLAVEFPNGRRVEERVTRYLTRSEQGQAQTICSFITGNGVNVRSGPGDRYQVITRLNRGDGVRALYRRGNWVRLAATEDAVSGRLLRSLDGWVSNRYINGCSEDQFDRWRQ